MAGVLHGIVSLCDGWNNLPSGEQYNTLARLIRSMTITGGDVTVNTAGGLHLELDADALAQSIAENPGLPVTIIQNQTFIQNLANNYYFAQTLVNNQQFTQLLSNNTHFVQNLAQNDTFVEVLINNNSTFVEELTQNQTFADWVRRLAGTGAGSFRLSYDAAAGVVRLSGGQIVAGTHAVTIPSAEYPAGTSMSFYAVVYYNSGEWYLGIQNTVPAMPNAWSEYIGSVDAAGNITQAWTGDGAVRVTDRWVD